MLSLIVEKVTQSQTGNERSAIFDYMVIAINCRFLQQEPLEGYGYFIREILRVWLQKHPDHRYHLFFDRPPHPEAFFTDNVSLHHIAPKARHPFLWKWWFDVAIALKLKQIKADVFFSADGFASLTTTVPQCIVVHDLSFLKHPAHYRKSHAAFYRKYTARFVSKAAAVATVSEFSKRALLDEYGTKAGKIKVVYSAAKPAFHPLGEEEKTTIREKKTDGKHYFLYTGAIHPRKNLLNLLRAFSLFKKRMQSEMKLVLAGRLGWKTQEFEKLIATYKFRDDLLLTGYIDEATLTGLTAAAYALVYPSFYEGFGVPVVEAMQSGVPVITSCDSAMQEVADDAGLYGDPSDINDMAAKMMQLYRDEALRADLIRKGLRRAAWFSWEKTADLAWEALMEIPVR